jgi:mycobactin phenyloxazoline synthetase
MTTTPQADPAPADPAPEAAGTDGPDDTPAELTAIWAELLALDPTDVPGDVSFLRLGGDSVLSVQLAARIRNRLGVVLALSDLSVETTLDDLCALVARRAASGPSPGTLPVTLQRRSDPTAPFDLLSLQQGYFVGQHDGWELSYDSAHFYGDVGFTDVDGDEAVDALEDALTRLAAHQPTLRARVTDDGRQHVLPLDAPGAVPPLQVTDLRDADDHEVAAALAAIRDEMSTTGPDPTRGPAYDVRLTLLPGDRARLHTAMSLIVFDGWSATVLNRELLLLAADWNAVLAPLELDFGDYVASVRELPATGAWSADRDWWWDRLDDAPHAPALPLRRDPREVHPRLMGTREARLPAEDWQHLREACAAHDVTPSAAMLTAFAVVVSRWAGHRRLLLNSLQLNRLPLHPDVHRMLGACAATMLVPLELATSGTFAELAAATQRSFTEHAAHTLVSGVDVSRELARRRGTHRPVAPVVFQSTLGMDAAVGEAQVTSAGPLGDLHLDDYHHQLRTPQVALEARLYELGGEMAVVVSLVEELFDPAEVDAAFDELVGWARSLAAGPGWQETVALPEPLDPPTDGLRLGRYEARPAAADAGPLRDDLEQRIATVWEDLLDTPVLDRGADFFRLGGDSLLAVRALTVVARRTGAPVALGDFLDTPTVAGLAAAVRAAGAGGEAPSDGAGRAEP